MATLAATSPVCCGGLVRLSGRVSNIFFACLTTSAGGFSFSVITGVNLLGLFMRGVMIGLMAKVPLSSSCMDFGLLFDGWVWVCVGAVGGSPFGL